MDKELAQKLLKKVKDDYEIIAADYSASRPASWRELSIFNDLVKDGDRVLDLGCGNGRLIELFVGKNIDYLGVDNSKNLIDIAKKHHPNNNFLLADALNLSLEDKTFDAIFSIAVLHHIPSRELRIKFFNEAKRILKPNGILVLTVWNLLTRKTILSYLRCSLLKGLGLSKLDFGDLFVSWSDKANRYYHLFSKGELERLAKEAGFEVNKVGLAKAYRGGRRSNLYLIAKKP